MMTSFTAPVVRGEMTDVREYISRCAYGIGYLRAFGFEDLDAPLPREVHERARFSQRVEEARARVEELESTSEADRISMHAAACAERESLRARWAKEYEEERERVEAMEAAVRAWRPPTPDHDTLKAFALRQLDQSGPIGDRPHDPGPVDDDVSAWFRAELKEARRRLADCEEDLRRERSLVRKVNEWLRALRESLGWSPAAEGDDR